MKQWFDLSVALCLARYVTIAHSDEVGLVKGGQLIALVSFRVAARSVLAGPCRSVSVFEQLAEPQHLAVYRERDTPRTR